MRMSNYLGRGAVRSSVMAASHPEFGMNHVTVVPTNLQSADSDDDEERAPDATR